MYKIIPSMNIPPWLVVIKYIYRPRFYLKTTTQDMKS